MLQRLFFVAKREGARTWEAEVFPGLGGKATVVVHGLAALDQDDADDSEDVVVGGVEVPFIPFILWHLYQKLVEHELYTGGREGGSACGWWR